MPEVQAASSNQSFTEETKPLQPAIEPFRNEAIPELPENKQVKVTNEELQVIATKRGNGYIQVSPNNEYIISPAPISGYTPIPVTDIPGFANGGFVVMQNQDGSISVFQELTPLQKLMAKAESKGLRIEQTDKTKFSVYRGGELLKENLNLIQLGVFVNAYKSEQVFSETATNKETVPTLTEENKANDLPKLDIQFTRNGVEGSFIGGMEFIGEGSESTVYRDGSTVIKVSEPYSDKSEETFNERVNNALLIDQLVGNGTLEVVGTYESSNGTLNPVFRQEFTDGRAATIDEINAHMISKGFRIIAEGKYGNTYSKTENGYEYTIKDMDQDNVRVEKSGKVSVIDGVVTVKQIEQKDETFGPVSESTPTPTLAPAAKTAESEAYPDLAEKPDNQDKPQSPAELAPKQLNISQINQLAKKMGYTISKKLDNGSYNILNGETVVANKPNYKAIGEWLETAGDAVQQAEPVVETAKPAPLQIGDYVRVSDGTAKPPANHKKDLKRWDGRNFTGWVHRLDASKVAIDKDGDGILVNVISPADYTITKVAEDRQRPVKPSPPKKGFERTAFGNIAIGDVFRQSHDTDKNGNDRYTLYRKTAPGKAVIVEHVNGGYGDGNSVGHESNVSVAAIVFKKNVPAATQEVASEAAPVTLKELYSQQDKEIASIDEHFKAEEKRLSKEKAEAKRKRNSRKVAVLEDEYAELKTKTAEQRKAVYDKYRDLITAHPEYIAEKAESVAKTKAMQAERAADEATAKDRTDASMIGKIMEQGGFGEVRKDLQDKIKHKQKVIDRGAKGTTLVAAQSQIDVLNSQLAELDRLEGKQAPEQPTPEVAKDAPAVVPQAKFVFDFDSDNDVKIIVDMMKQAALRFGTAQEFENYIKSTPGFWLDVAMQFRKDTGEMLPGNYEAHLAQESSKMGNMEAGSKKRNASFDFEAFHQMAHSQKPEAQPDRGVTATLIFSPEFAKITAEAKARMASLKNIERAIAYIEKDIKRYIEMRGREDINSEVLEQAISDRETELAALIKSKNDMDKSDYVESLDVNDVLKAANSATIQSKETIQEGGAENANTEVQPEDGIGGEAIINSPALAADTGEKTGRDAGTGNEGQSTKNIPAIEKERKTPIVSGDQGTGDVRGVPDSIGRTREQGLPEIPESERPVSTGSSSTRSDKNSVEPSRGELDRVQRFGTDYRIPTGGLKREGSWVATAKRNLDIIKLVKQIEAEKRHATPEE